jgi:hypothetical protein
MCLNFFVFKPLSWEVYDSKPNNWTFFILLEFRHKQKIIFQKFDKTKNNLIYVEMVKVLQYLQMLP